MYNVACEYIDIVCVCSWVLILIRCTEALAALSREDGMRAYQNTFCIQIAILTPNTNMHACTYLIAV